MDTQLVRLDAPYNIISNSNGRFALHIATLIVIEKQNRPADIHGGTREETIVKSYPVVAYDGYSLGGEVWMGTELKDCHCVCKSGKNVTLYTLKTLMEYCAKKESPNFPEMIPLIFNSYTMINGSELQLPRDSKGKAIEDYEVRLVFDEGNNGDSCAVYSAADSLFYFSRYFSNDPLSIPNIPTNNEIIKFLAEDRDNYLKTFHYKGIRSITFTTKDQKYQWLVDRLNNYNSNE